MDPSAIASSVNAVKNAARYSTDKSHLVSPYMFICCWIPSLAFLVLYFFIQAKYSRPETEMQCTETPGYTLSYIHLYCLEESYSILDLKQKGMYELDDHAGVGQELPGMDIRNRVELSYLHPIILVCGLLYAFPILFWKFCFRTFRVHEVIALLSPAPSVRPENFKEDEERRMEELEITLDVIFSQRCQLARSYFFCELLIPLCNAIAWALMIGSIGEELIYYGIAAVTEPFLYHPDMTIQDLVFPSKMNCKLPSIGPSGTPQRFTAICYFPANAVYQKAFIGIWFLSLGQIFLVFGVTLLVFGFRCGPATRSVALTQYVPSEWKSQMDTFGRNLDYSAWLVVFYIVKNTTVVGATKFIPVASDVWEKRKKRKSKVLLVNSSHLTETTSV